MMGMLGGMRIPSVPEPAKLPNNAERLYPLARSSGYAADPTVAAVAMLEPLVAPKSEHNTTFDNKSLPGRRSNNVVKARYTRTLSTNGTNNSPRRIKRGKATRGKL